MTGRPLVAGVDSSTRSTKVELRDLATGELVVSGRGAHPDTHPPVSEQHPDDWWAALVDAFAQCGDHRADVVAVSVAGQQHGLVLLDDEFRPVRPAPLWNDTTGAAAAARLVDALGADVWANACGSVPVAAFTVAKLAHLAATEPEVLGRAAHALLPHDELTRRLTGRCTTDRGDASGTGWFSAATGEYRSDLLELAAPGVADPAWLPEVLGPDDAAGELQSAAAAALGLPVGIPVGPGTGDNMAAALGVGLGPGDLCMSLGTSGTVYACADRPAADPTGAVAGFADATGGFLPLVCTLNATKVTDALAALLGVDHATWDQLALDGTSSGLTLLPWFDGERTPDRPDATGVLSGLRPDVSRAQLARAAVEGVLCGLLDGVDALETAVGPAAGRRVLTGGGARSAAYRQVLADLSGQSWTAVADEEFVARGAALQAAAIANGAPVTAQLDTWPTPGGELVEPGPAAVVGPEVRTAYAQLRDRS